MARLVTAPNNKVGGSRRQHQQQQHHQQHQQQTYPSDEKLTTKTGESLESNNSDTGFDLGIVERIIDDILSSSEANNGIIVEPEEGKSQQSDDMTNDEVTRSKYFFNKRTRDGTSITNKARDSNYSSHVIMIEAQQRKADYATEDAIFSSVDAQTRDEILLFIATHPMMSPSSVPRPSAALLRKFMDGVRDKAASCGMDKSAIAGLVQYAERIYAELYGNNNGLKEEDGFLFRVVDNRRSMERGKGSAKRQRREDARDNSGFQRPMIHAT